MAGWSNFRVTNFKRFSTAVAPPANSPFKPTLLRGAA